MDIGKYRQGGLNDTGQVDADPQIQQKIYPEFSIEKKIGDYKFGDVFKATIRLKVQRVEEGNLNFDDRESYKIVLQVIDISPEVPENKGLPRPIDPTMHGVPMGGDSEGGY
jgi:hypothetical protein